MLIKHTVSLQSIKICGSCKLTKCLTQTYQPYEDSYIPSLRSVYKGYNKVNNRNVSEYISELSQEHKYTLHNIIVSYCLASNILKHCNLGVWGVYRVQWFKKLNSWKHHLSYAEAEQFSATEYPLKYYDCNILYSTLTVPSNVLIKHCSFIYSCAT